MSRRSSEAALAVHPEYLRLALEPDSGFFINFDRLGEAGIRMLHEVVSGDDAELAIAAVRLAAHLQTRGSLAVVELAARSHDSRLREEAALALRRRRDHAPSLLARLLMDPGPRVRARALAALAARPPHARLRYMTLLRRLRTEDPDQRVRALAERIRVIVPS